MRYLLLLLVVPMVFGSIYDGLGEGIDELYSSTIYDGDTLELESKIFQVTATGTKASLKGDGVNIIVNEDDCALQNTYGFCVDDIETTDNGRREVTVRIYALYPTFELNETMTGNTSDILVIGDTLSLQMSLKNVGQVTANPALFTLEFPSALSVTSVSSPCKKNDNRITYNGKLDSYQDITCTYVLKVISKLSYAQTATILSFVGDKEFTEQQASQDYIVEEPILLEMVANKTTLALNEPFIYNITLRNRHTISTSIKDIILDLQGFVGFDSLPSGVTNKGTLLFVKEQRLEGRENVTLQLSLYPLRSGEYVPMISATQIYGGVTSYMVAYSTELEIEEEEEITIESDILDTLDALQSSLYSVWVTNPNVFLAMENLTLKTYTNLTFISSARLGTLAPGAKRKILGQSFQVPHVNSTTDFSIYLNVSYVNAFGDFVSVIEEDSTSVEAINGLTIDHEIGETTLYGGNWTTFSVSVTNDRTEDLTNVYVRSQSEGLTFLGKKSVSIDIPAGDTVTAYTIHILVPEISQSQNMEYSTTASFLYKRLPYSYSETGEVGVAPATEQSSTQDIFYPLELTRTVEPTPQEQGDRFYLTYALENTGNVSITNLQILFPQSENFDLVGDGSVTVDLLPPGTNMTLSKIALMRSKRSGEIIVPEDRVQYFYNQRAYDNLTQNTSLTLESQQVSALMFYRMVHVDSMSPVFTLSIENIGSERIVYEVVDGSYVATGDVGPYQTQKHEFHEVYDEGPHLRSPADIHYETLEGKMQGFSNTTYFTITAPVVNVSIIPPVIPEVVVDVLPAVVEEPIVAESEAAPQIPEQINRPSAFARFFGSLKKTVLGWLR